MSNLTFSEKKIIQKYFKMSFAAVVIGALRVKINTRSGPYHEKTSLRDMYEQQWSSSASEDITKTYLYNVDPHKLHFYIVKLGFTGVYIIFLISAQKHRLWVLVRTASSRRF